MASFTLLVTPDEDNQLIFLNGFNKIVNVSPNTGGTAIKSGSKPRTGSRVVINTKCNK